MTASTRPFRFAVQQFSAGTGKEWTEVARRAEGDGYSALHLADHYFGNGPLEASTHHPVQGLAAIPAIAHAAAVTSTMKVGCRVFCIDYHYPAVLAKEAATIDLLSDGRLELGLGAGWIRDEYDAMGIPFDRGGRAHRPAGGGHRTDACPLHRRADRPAAASTSPCTATPVSPRRCRSRARRS